MDVQQILALSLVAAAAVYLAVRLVRRRRNVKFRECADCPAADHPTGRPASGTDPEPRDARVRP